jgi:ferredoxin-NADP reductase
MGVYKVKLINKETVATDTMAFHFEKPTGFNFKAGQYADYVQIDPSQTDKEGTQRSFTLACAPYEDDICFITRMRDTAFKRVMKDMTIGTEIKIDGPNGNLMLKDNTTPAVFLTGGIGVTPALSIIKQAVHDHSDQKIILFYSNGNLESAVHMDKLYEMAKLNSNFTFVPTLTETLSGDFHGESGRIDIGMLHKYIPDLSIPNFYVTGPPTMVKSLRQILISNGINKRHIFTEEFEGYK